MASPRASRNAGCRNRPNPAYQTLRLPLPKAKQCLLPNRSVPGRHREKQNYPLRMRGVSHQAVQALTLASGYIRATRRVGREDAVVRFDMRAAPLGVVAHWPRSKRPPLSPGANRAAAAQKVRVPGWNHFLVTHRRL